MKTKLTLNVDQQVIRKAKRYSRNKNISLSQLVEDVLANLELTKSKGKQSITDRLAGIAKGAIPDDADYKKAIRNIVAEKHLSKK